MAGDDAGIELQSTVSVPMHDENTEPSSPTHSTADIIQRDRNSHQHPHRRQWASISMARFPTMMGDHVNIEGRYFDPKTQIRSAWKRELYLLLEDSSSSRAALWVNMSVTGMILLSAVLTTVETIPAARAVGNMFWFVLETIMVFFFTIEFILRLLAHSDSMMLIKRFFTSPLVILDILAILPYYIEVIARHETTYEFRFTILRIFRLLRIFKPYRYTSTLAMTIEVLIIAMGRSADALGALLFFMVATVIIFSTLLYFAERGEWDDTKKIFLDADGNPSSFDSIPAAIWYILVTITTTGYGDMVPTTFVGKLITIPAMLFGILLIALPSIIVGRNFSIVWEIMRKYYRSQSEQNRVATENHGEDEDEEEEPQDSLYQMLGGNERTRPSFDVISPTTPTSSHPRRRHQRDEGGEGGDLKEKVQELFEMTRRNQETLERLMKIMGENADARSDR
ncbi:uncharacterized protein VTP21DRAFT_10508 [Calcarisporiella thermophila]|uniref:uncharacterized protein n=1 Tax=Calcarisporiella thermophila TaxID=911321 RepID=UPI003742090F